MRIALIVSVLVCLAATGGCRTESANTEFYVQGHPRQKYEYKEVRRLVKKLARGTPRHQVMIRLGSPAEMRGNTWIYLPEKPGFLVPRELLEVRFERGVFVSYDFKPIVFGRTPAS